jgi:hypothetical protein
MAKAPQNYPLHWPSHRPRKKTRVAGSFKSGQQPITLTPALDRLENELRRFGAMHVVISTNIEPRLDGRPRAGQPQPTDPGAVAYCSIRGKPFALACDTFNKVEQNIAALAAHIDATRAQERYGVASAEESLQAFSALPPPATGPVVRPWREVLSFGPTFPTDMEPQDAALVVGAKFKRLAEKLHPDKGGTTEAMAELNCAKDEALKEIGD